MSYAVGTSTSLRWPVAAPRGTVYLSAGQRSVLWAARRQVGRGPITLAGLTDLVGGASRGRTWHQLARLRQLGLLGWRSWPAPKDPGDRRVSPGRHGHLILWLPRAARAAYRGTRRRRLPVANDSPSTPFGGFITAAGVAAAWGSAAAPPAPAPRRLHGPPAGASAAVAGPAASSRSPGWRQPPRVLHARCPAGHRCRIRRTAWRRSLAELVGEWVGRCRRCDRTVRELVRVRLPAAPPRPDSGDELQDPGLRARRAAAAAAMLAELPDLAPGVRELLIRDYLPERRRPPPD